MGNGQVRLVFPEGYTFTGTRNGTQVMLSRRSSHNYNGPWFADETIRGAFVGNVLRGQYEYQECNARRPQSCPGNCTIRASVTAQPGVR